MIDRFPFRYTEDEALRFRTVDRMEQPIDPVIDAALKTVNIQGERILDYGCGQGRMAPELLRHGATDVVGCEPSADMVKWANKFLMEGMRGDPARVHFELLETLPLPYGSDSFGGALSRFVFHYIRETKEVLAELHRVLKPGGWLVAVFSDVHFAPGYEHLANVDLPLKFIGGASAQTFAKPGREIVENAKAVGFEITRYENVDNGSIATVDESFPHRDKVKLETGLLVALKKAK